MKAASKILLYLITGSILYGQWVPQLSGTNYALKSVYFVNENTGLACGHSQVLKTTNGGINWQINFLQGSHNCITFVNETTGFICSDSGKIYKTTNAGANWFSLPSGTLSNIISISFFNSQTGIAAGYGKTILKTTDGGSNWFSIANLIWQIDFISTKILDQDNYFVGGYNTYIIRTTNGGINWITHTHSEPNPFFSIEFINNNTGWVTGCCGMFMRTTDGGVNWEDMYYLTLGFTLYTIEYVNSNTGYVCGDGGLVYRTTNQGASWDSTLTSGTDQILYSLFMVNENTGWVVGGYGTILKTTNGGGPGFPIGIKQISSEVPQEFSLSQNYPNPFNPNTTIRFRIAVSGFTSLKIYDIQGKEVVVLVARELNQGAYEVDWNAVEYPSGIYFCKFITSDFSATMKMALVK